MTREKTKMAECEIDTIKIRLNAIVLILLATRFSDAKGKIVISDAAPLLHLAGYSPTEIATLFGKKKATEVSQYLYPKKS